MTDAERLAKAYTDDRGLWWPAPGIVEVFQRLIDSGVVTVNPPPDPAAQVRAEYVRRWGSMTAVETLMSMLDDGWITPGPTCEQ